jgi:DNA-binding response OmpR family regulator
MVKAKILLVEDDANLGMVIKDNLEDLGYKVNLCDDGKLGLQSFYENKVDLCIFDVMLPKKDGFSLAEEIRKTDQKTPIVFLTAKSLQEDRIKGFKIGADDYVTKPFSMEEFALRIEAILKRSMEKESIEERSEFILGNYVFSYANLTLTTNNNIQSLTRKEAEILKLLCININEVLKREIVLNIVWGNDDYFLGRSMDVFITKLRKYLKEDPNIKIVNIHGVGFKLEVKK